MPMKFRPRRPGNRLGAEELGLLAKKLAAARDPKQAAQLRERLTRGFYGILKNCRLPLFD
ncbi:MAG: hypothetical protein ACLQOO_24255 [Terriglobia bacterium]